MQEIVTVLKENRFCVFVFYVADWSLSSEDVLLRLQSFLRSPKHAEIATRIATKRCFPRSL